MNTETLEQFQARAQKVMDNMGGNPTATPQVAPDPALEKFQALMEKAQADEADLRRPDGSARHTPEEVIDRTERIRAEVTAALTAYQAPLIEAQAAVKAELAELAEFDPNSILADLSADELTRANGLRSFVKEDVASLPAPDLAPAIAAAIASDDRPSLVLYLREIPKRIDAIGKKLSLSERSAWANLENTIKNHVTPADDGKREALQKRHKELTLARSVAVRLTEGKGARVNF